MSKNNFNFEQDNSDLQSDSQAAKIAVIAGAISTFGDALATLSAILAIEEERQEKSGTSDNRNLQKQIDNLTYEIQKIKNQISGQNRYYL
ncbi:hypothetical protein [Psychrobacillus psychrodurans]|uniref:Translation initiation factor 2 n=1 Tax=Psychrobacillus psychrodurans TaxID=126157 RepID=A0A9X3LAP4_9BACI|nr:hypothetical protein [Psychrobacillus psychrodurans]MCZ8533211.1 hypothetical protein [Psychrobacillus psychrodurans]